MNKPVTQEEIVYALRLAGVNLGGMNPLADRIQAHGIAPPDGWVLVSEQAIIDCIEIAMDNTAGARIPECGQFGLIAQILSSEYHPKPKPEDV